MGVYNCRGSRANCLKIKIVREGAMFFFSLLNKLSKSKATGLENISAKLIRECAEHFQ